MRTVVRMKKWTESGTGDGLQWAIKKETKRGYSLVVAILGGEKDTDPFDVPKAFDDLCRANGYKKDPKWKPPKTKRKGNA